MATSKVHSYLFIQFFMDKTFRGFQIPSEQIRSRGMLIYGKTGSGKSTLMKKLALRDFTSGHGVCIIDQYGDFAEQSLSLIPESRLSQVIYLDLSEMNPEDTTFECDNFGIDFHSLLSEKKILIVR